MEKFAFLVIPADLEQIRHYWPLTRLIPDFILKSFLKTKRSFEVLHFCSHKDKLEGYFFILPKIIGDVSLAGPDFLMDKIFNAYRLAERMGINILGTDLNVPLSLEKLALKAKKRKTAITCGNSFTAWSIFESIYRTAKTEDIDLKKSVVAISDAATPTGALSVKKFSAYVPKIIIHGKSKEKLESLKKTVSEFNSTEIVLEEDLAKAAESADIMIFNESSVGKSLDKWRLKPGSILCDVTPNNVLSKLNHNTQLSVIKGNVIKLPSTIECNVNFSLPKNMVSAALAETILLALEGKFVNYSFGENINPDKMEEIADIATRHGFQVWLPEGGLF